MVTENQFAMVTTESYVDWCTILAGSVAAVALSVVFLQFGAGIGLADTDALTADPANITPMKLLIAGVYILFVQVVASLIGGYIAGRMRKPVLNASLHEREVRDGMHGLLVWSTGTLIMVAAAAIVTAFSELAVEPIPEVERSQDLLQRETVISVILAFSAAATSLVSAVAAWYAATKGGDHRDRNVDYSNRISFLKR